MASSSTFQFRVNRCFSFDASSSNPNPNRSSPRFASFRKPASVRNKAILKASLSAAPNLNLHELRGDSDSEKIDHEKIDKWMPEAVVEIVKNLKQAPLLMQVYESGLKTEKAVEENWPLMKEAWSEDVPEGVILVEEIEEEDEATKAWGIVIQGRGCEYGPACYLLKTSRVRSSVGLGVCTHFCLTKVTSFRETALSQLTNSWLLR